MIGLVSEGGMLSNNDERLRRCKEEAMKGEGGEVAILAFKITLG